MMLAILKTYNICIMMALLNFWIQNYTCRTLNKGLLLSSATKQQIVQSSTPSTTLNSERISSFSTTLLQDYEHLKDDIDYQTYESGSSILNEEENDDDNEEIIQSNYLGYDEDIENEDDLDEFDFFESNFKDDTKPTETAEVWKINEERKGLAMEKNGKRLFEGDIILDPITRLKIEVDRMPARRKRAVKKDSVSRWINRTIPYVVSSELSYKTRRQIRRAIRHWRKRTCLQFRPKEIQDKDYINFVIDEGCWSNVGRMGGEQKISIGEGCRQVGTIIHEIGHAIGFWHEQARRDRDKYIRIMRDNIAEEQRKQFRRMPASWMNSMGYAYDYWSIMHYGKDFFSKNNKPTIKIRKIGRRVGAQIGQRKGLSHLDIAQVNAMYQCNSILPEKKECFNDRNGQGYRGKRNYSEQGVTCQHWHADWPHEINQKWEDGTDGLGKHNYCRNPGGKRKRPWCYTTLTDTKWQYCNVESCN